MPPPNAATKDGSTRSAPRLLLGVAWVLLAARVATGVYEEAHPPKTPDRVHWRPIASAVAEARTSQRPILYDFTAEWCAPCQAMQREVFSDRASASMLENQFVPVRVLDRRREEGRNAPDVDSLQARFGVTAFPTLVVVSAAGGDSVVIAGYPGKATTIQRLSQARTNLVMRRVGIHFP